MVNTVAGLLQDGRQFPVALLPPRRQQPLVVERLKFGRPLPEHVVEARPAALNPESRPPVQYNATCNFLGLKLTQSRKFQMRKDQPSTGRNIEVLQ